jgi:hypothetical protein
LEHERMNRGYTLLWRKIWSNSLLCEPGRKFSRPEAWLYIANVLAAGTDHEAAGLKRGDFVASIRFLAECFNWSTTQRFIDLLLENSMNSRVVREAVRRLVQDAGHFMVCNYDTYNQARYAERYNIKEVIKDTHVPSGDGVRVSAKILVEIFQPQNQLLPEVKALTSERLKKCRSRIDQAVRDGCLEQYLSDFSAAVKKAQQTPFLRGEGARGWRASFDWFVANHVNIYAVLEGKYDGPAAASSNRNGGNHAISSTDYDCEPGGTSNRRTSRGDPIYRPRQ